MNSKVNGVVVLTKHFFIQLPLKGQNGRACRRNVEKPQFEQPCPTEVPFEENMDKAQPLNLCLENNHPIKLPEVNSRFKLLSEKVYFPLHDKKIPLFFILQTQ